MPPPDSRHSPWQIYAKALFQHYGYPLWHAEPEVDKQYGLREIELGSVGWVDEGKFRHLFNARKAKDDPFNEGKVPESFERFDPKNMQETAPEPVIVQPYVASRHISNVSVSGDASARYKIYLVSSGGSRPR